MTSLNRLSRQEKKIILRRHLKNKESLEVIHYDYRHLYSLEFFYRIPSLLMQKKQFYDYVLCKLMGKDMNEFYQCKSTCIGNKKESYWETEDDITFHLSTYSSLSPAEKEIYMR